jgi:ClpP class serine protease
MEIQFDLNMSKQQRQQMKQMMEKMKNMPEQQRERMQQMMGGQMDMLKQMMSDEPMVIEVQNVSVNANLPDGIF